MNKGLKIFLLAFAVLIALGVTLVFLKTILDPPSSMRDIDPFERNLKEETALMNRLTAKAPQDSLFYLVLDEVSVQGENSLLEPDLRDRLLRDFLSVYTPKYQQECNDLFRSSWRLSDFDAISGRLAEIKACKTSDGSEAYPSSAVSELTQLFSTVNGARRCARTQNYVDEESARESIASAKNYASTAPVANCRELVQALGKVADKLEASHYSQIEAIAGRMAGFAGNYYSLDGVNSDLNKVNALIESYRNLSRVYPARSLDNLEDRISDSYSDACSYFRSSDWF